MTSSATDFAMACTEYLLTVLLALTTAVASGDDESSSDVPPQNGNGTDSNESVAEGEMVSELGKSVMYVFQARNDDYWFGSNDVGRYHSDPGGH